MHTLVIQLPRSIVYKTFCRYLSIKHSNIQEQPQKQHGHTVSKFKPFNVVHNKSGRKSWIEKPCKIMSATLQTDVIVHFKGVVLTAKIRLQSLGRGAQF